MPSPQIANVTSMISIKWILLEFFFINCLLNFDDYALKVLILLTSSPMKMTMAKTLDENATFEKT